MKRETVQSEITKTSIEKHDTAAWANITSMKEISKVTIPSEVEVTDAKDYVDGNEK